jgi:hypothetical protein
MIIERKFLNNLKSSAFRYYKTIEKWIYLREGKKLFRKNNLLKRTHSKHYSLRIKEYWRNHYGKPVNPLWHMIYANVIGKQDVRYIPHHIWRVEIHPFFNKIPMKHALLDKNLSDVLFNGYNAPETIIKRMHSRYYGYDNKPISRKDAIDRIYSGPPEQIIKASDTDRGYGVRKLVLDSGKIVLNGKSSTMDDLEKLYGPNFIVQSKIIQHRVMAAPHPDSVNTVRLVTFRWGDDIGVLLAFARFGRDRKVIDNATGGGLCCGIDEQGLLNSRAVDTYGILYRNHPTTGYDFRCLTYIPGYKRICEYGIAMHRKIFHFDIIGWDFALDEGGDPIFLEINYRGGWIYQFAIERPMFGELTSEVLEYVRDNRNKRT